jgi:hypothetical protein
LSVIKSIRNNIGTGRVYKILLRTIFLASDRGMRKIWFCPYQPAPLSITIGVPPCPEQPSLFAYKPLAPRRITIISIINCFIAIG